MIKTTPVVISDVISTIAFDVARGVLDVESLRNPSRTAMLLDEIRFQLISDPAFTTAAGAVFQARLDLARLSLTGGSYVPIALICRAEDVAIDELTNVAAAGSTVSPSSAVQVYIWRLPKPLYIPANEVLVPSIRIPTIPGVTITPSNNAVHITYVGRALPADAPEPKFVNAPFLTSWVDVRRRGLSDYLAVRSSRSDLKNPFAEKLYVERLTGTVLFQVLTTIYMPASDFSGQSPAANNLMLSDLERIGNDLITSRLYKSDGTILARDPTPFLHLFDWETRSLGVCSVLERNQFYLIQSDILLSSIASAGGEGGNAWTQAMVGMVGYRKVAYAGGGNFAERA
jgi:hypothetical protein